MNTSKHQFAEAQVNGVCENPDVRERLPVYITNPLEDPSANEVEDHLLDCRHCRELFVMMLRLHNEARSAKNLRGGGGNGRAANEAQVLRLADFRKDWP